MDHAGHLDCLPERRGGRVALASTGAAAPGRRRDSGGDGQPPTSRTIDLGFAFPPWGDVTGEFVVQASRSRSRSRSMTRRVGIGSIPSQAHANSTWVNTTVVAPKR